MSATILLRRILILLSVAFATVVTCHAQTAGEPEKLTKMRKIYEAEILKRKLPILKKLAADLDALEKSLTRANKLDEAIKARKERVEVENTIKSLGATVSTRSKKVTKRTPKPSRDDMKEFKIPMGTASLQGRLSRPASGSYITKWVTTTCLATWTGGDIVPGLYDVYIDYASDYRYGGGELRFEELSQDFQCVIRPGQSRTSMKVGTFKLGTKLGFSIRSLSKNRYGVMNLYGVTFKPSAQQ